MFCGLYFRFFSSAAIAGSFQRGRQRAFGLVFRLIVLLLYTGSNAGQFCDGGSDLSKIHLLDQSKFLFEFLQYELLCKSVSRTDGYSSNQSFISIRKGLVTPGFGWGYMSEMFIEPKAVCSSFQR